MLFKTNSNNNKMRRITKIKSKIMTKTKAKTSKSNKKKTNKMNKMKRRMTIKSNKTMTNKISNRMNLDNKSVKKFLRTIKISSHNLTQKKILTLKKAFKQKMEKLNFNCLKLSSLSKKLKSLNKFMPSSRLTIDRKLNWLI